MDVDLRRPWPFALFVIVAHVLCRFVGVAFMVSSGVYRAAGAFDFFPGDTWGIVSPLQHPPLAYGFVAVGGLWTFLVAVLISMDVVRFFGGPGRDLRREALMVILFWIVTAPPAFLPGVSGFGAPEGAPLPYVAGFSPLVCGVAGLPLYAGLWLPQR